MKKYFATILLVILIGLSFGAMPANTANAATKTVAKVTWSPAALKELRKVPGFVRAKVKAKINAYAIKHKIKTITPKIYKSIHV